MRRSSGRELEHQAAAIPTMDALFIAASRAVEVSRLIEYEIASRGSAKAFIREAVDDRLLPTAPSGLGQFEDGAPEGGPSIRSASLNQI